MAIVTKAEGSCYSEIQIYNYMNIFYFGITDGLNTDKS